MRLKSIMEGLNEKIQYSYNLIPNHGDSNHKTLMSIITNISESVSKKFDKINTKYFEFANPYKRTIDKEIANISDNGEDAQK
jgi:hypothetical protein